jgi:GNAT superfamily N-acetyltransferase
MNDPRATPLAASPLPTRAVRFEEVSDVLRLVRRAIEQGCRHHYDPAQRAAVYGSYARCLFVDAVAPSALETVVVEQEGHIMAVAQLDHEDQRLRALFVDDAHQRAGIGRALLANVEERVRARGGARLHGAMSLNAVPFYLRAGFRSCGGRERLVSVGIALPVLRMEKDLRRQPPR